MRSNSRKLPIPDGWEDITIGQVADVVGGSTPSTNNPEYWNGGVPWATPTDITALEGRYIAKTQTTISELGLKNSGASLIPARSVLMTSRATIGACAINTVPMATNQGFASLIPKNGINTEFLYYLLTIRANELQQLAAGSTFVELGRKQLRKLHLLCPPETQQAKIVEILNSVDDAIEATLAVIEQTHRLKAVVLQELLSKGIGHTQFKKIKVGRIPKTWGICAIGDLCEFSSGHGFSHKDWSRYGLPIIRIQNLNGSKEFNYYNSTPDPSWIVEQGELLFAWAGVKGVSFGPCIWPGPRGLLNQHIYRIRPNVGVDKHWLYAILGEVTQRIEAKAHGFKKSLVHVHKSYITGQIVPVPPSDEQKIISKRIDNLGELEKAQAAHLEQLLRTKTALSQGLLTGRIPVKVEGVH